MSLTVYLDARRPVRQPARLGYGGSAGRGGSLLRFAGEEIDLRKFLRAVHLALGGVDGEMPEDDPRLDFVRVLQHAEVAPGQAPGYVSLRIPELPWPQPAPTTE